MLRWYQAQGLYKTTKLAYCIKPQTQWALSPPQSPTTQKAIPQFYCSYVEHRQCKSAQRQPNKISGFLQNDKSAFFAALEVVRVLHTVSSTVHHSWFKSNKVVAKSPERREKTGPWQILCWSESDQINANLHLHLVVISWLFVTHCSKNRLRFTPTLRDLHPKFYVTEFFISQDEPALRFCRSTWGGPKLYCSTVHHSWIKATRMRQNPLTLTGRNLALKEGIDCMASNKYKYSLVSSLRKSPD